MRILGFSGGLDPRHPATHRPDDYRFVTGPFVFHDSAAVLVEDGEVVSAIEQERLDRIKHSNRFAADAIRFCLEDRGLELEDLDGIAYYSRERPVDWMVGTHMLWNPWLDPVWDGRSLIVELFRRHFGRGIDPAKLSFVDHHTAHAMSASAMAPFDESLVITLDGQGNGLSGTVFTGARQRLKLLREIPHSQSLGDLYTNAIGLLGYRQFDEYKVMGLAPYGDPSRFRDLFSTLYTLGSGGAFQIHRERIASLLSIGPPRRQGEPFTQVHKDFAAALQEALETVVFHHVEHYRQATGARYLTLAGGLAHNCTLNGKLLRSGRFEDIFVQPASHDAGCALGAALCLYHEHAPEEPGRPLRNLYWGRPAGDTEEIAAELDAWSDFVEHRPLDDPYEGAARLLADGAVIGWVQGRSEFGPRALGNRSILADPRPAENKDRINEMVKKREGYRPFAPAVLEERVHHFFDVPEAKPFPYMVFVVPVREDARETLRAITHVDGTSRIQTVARDDNEEFWRLIEAFGRITGVPVLLNTSFNNHREPIVDSVRDAIVCFLTTGLGYLVVGDRLVEKKDGAAERIFDLVVSLPAHVRLEKRRQHLPDGGPDDLHLLDNTTWNGPPRTVSATIWSVLEGVDGRRTLGELASEAGQDRSAGLAEELWSLWSERLVALAPPRAVSG